MPRLLTSSLAHRYEDLYRVNGVKFLKVKPVFNSCMLNLLCPSRRMCILNFEYSDFLCIVQNKSINKLEAGIDGKVASVKLDDGSTIDADTVCLS